jgi:hypothetical protein
MKCSQIDSCWRPAMMPGCFFDYRAESGVQPHAVTVPCQAGVPSHNVGAAPHFDHDKCIAPHHGGTKHCRSARVFTYNQGLCESFSL